MKTLWNTLLLILFTVVMVSVVVILYASAVTGHWWVFGTLIAIVCLIPLFVRFTIVKEGTAKTIVRLGGFKKAVIAWEGHSLDGKWNVESEEEKHLLPGGLRFVGIWPFDRVFTYDFRWRDVQLIGGREQVQFHEKKGLDYIFIRPDVYWTDIKKAETAPPERIPLDVQFLVTMRVINPYRTLFVGPSNWNENAMARLNAMFRSWVGSKTLDQLLGLQRQAGNIQIWQELSQDPLVAFLRENWGIEIVENGIEIRDISLEKEYQKAAAAEQKMKLEAKGVVAGTTGALIESLSSLTGAEVREIQKEFKDNPDAAFQKYKKLIEENGDYIKRDMSLRRGARIDIGVQGAEGMERGLLNLLALWRMAPGGKGMPGGRQRAVAPGSLQALTPQKRRPEPEPEMTDEEAQRYADDFERETEEEEEEEVK